MSCFLCFLQYVFYFYVFILCSLQYVFYFYVFILWVCVLWVMSMSVLIRGFSRIPSQKRNSASRSDNSRAFAEIDAHQPADSAHRYAIEMAYAWIRGSAGGKVVVEGN